MCEARAKSRRDLTLFVLMQHDETFLLLRRSLYRSTMGTVFLMQRSLHRRTVTLCAVICNLPHMVTVPACRLSDNAVTVPVCFGSL